MEHFTKPYSSFPTKIFSLKWNFQAIIVNFQSILLLAHHYFFRFFRTRKKTNRINIPVGFFLLTIQHKSINYGEERFNLDY